MPAVSLIATRKTYGDVVAVDRVDLDIHRRELFTFLGPSGSGKTTVLHLIAGLITQTEGEIRILGENVSARPTYERNIGMVFQSLALFPHMSVFDNIAFPLRMRRTGRRDIARRVREALDVVGLPDIGRRRTDQLSGGQQQRVALARALVYNPTLLLLDEPLGALDKKLREQMQLELVRLHRELEVTIINVTHDQREALMLSDRIGVMHEGRIEQVGTSEQLYYVPETRFVAGFIGNANLICGRTEAHGGRTLLCTPDGARLPAGGRADAGLADCTLFLRAEAVTLRAAGGVGRSGGAVEGKVRLRVFEGESVYYEIAVPGLTQPLKASVANQRETFAVDDRVLAEWDPEEARLIVDSDD